MSKNKFFAVWDGKVPGVYSSWEQCRQQVYGYAEAKYKGFATLAEAQEALKSPYWDYVGKNNKAQKPHYTQLPTHLQPIVPSIAVDAACSGNPGIMEYRGVNTQTSEEIFHRGPFADGTNNVGEFLALVHGLALLKEYHNPLPLYSDSKTAMAWVRNKKAKTKLEATPHNQVLFDLIERAEKWLAENTFSTKILKWDTKEWGEIPADFGRK